MARTLALDYGLARSGLAWTDPLGLTAQPLPTVPTAQLLDELARRVADGPVHTLVLGWPRRLSGADTDLTPHAAALEQRLRAAFPALTLIRWDERLTSRAASQAIAQAGTRAQRRDKGLVDQVAAVLILQDYLASRG